MSLNRFEEFEVLIVFRIIVLYLIKNTIVNVHFICVTTHFEGIFYISKSDLRTVCMRVFRKRALEVTRASWHIIRIRPV